MASPTFAPGGHALAFTSKARASTDAVPPRIEVVQVPDLANACKQPDAGSSDLILDAENPDWSPAGVPTMPTAPDKGGTTDAGQGGGTTVDPGKGSATANDGKGTTPNPPGTTVVTKQGVTITVKPATVTDAIKRGLRPEIEVPGAGRIDLRVTVKGKTVASGKATTKRAATVKPKLTLNAAGKRALKKAKRAAFTLRITFRPRYGKTVTTTANGTLGG